jgi:2-(acetamidomethylene)succinate hydrolase
MSGAYSQLLGPHVKDTQVFALSTTPLFAVCAGEGIPVICMHGITANAYVFDPLIDLLADTFRVIAIDQRGHGRSGRPSGYEAEDFAQDTAALIQHLAAGPVVLLGHSLGARNALVTANRFPHLVRAVVAVDFTPFIENEVLEELAIRVQGGDRAFPDLGGVEAYLSARYARIPRDAIKRRARHGYKLTDDGFRPLADPHAMFLTVRGLKASLESTVRELRSNAILVRGLHSKLVSPAAWRKTRELRPDITAVEIPDADHYVPEEQPEAIAAVVRQVAAA